MYYEETDLCKRISNIGMKIISVPQSKIIHLVGMSNADNKNKKFNPFIFECVAESRVLYYNKHLGITRRNTARFINKINFAIRTLKSYIERDYYTKSVNHIYMSKS